MLSIKFIPKKAPYVKRYKLLLKMAPMLCIQFLPKKAPMLCVKFQPEKSPPPPHVKRGTVFTISLLKP